MKVPRSASPFLSLLACTFVAAAPHASASVMFLETFESPVVTPGSFISLATGTHTLDNPDWEVFQGDGSTTTGVFIDNGVIGFSSLTQTLGFGGGQDAGPNEASIVLEGFLGMNTPEISFDHFGTMIAQGVQVIVTDPNNGGALLYDSGSLTGDGSVISVLFDSAPVGDSVLLTVNQTGTTTNSDSAIDNIKITAIPEPSALLLLGLGSFGLALRRRRA